MTKNERYEVRRLALRARGLSRAEKQALDFISDAQTMRDGVCRKALKGAEDYGIGIRYVRYGLHGRRRKQKDGTSRLEYPGLIARGIVEVSGHIEGGRTLGGGGLTPAYTINVEALLKFIPDGSEGDDDTPTEKGEPKAEPKAEPISPKDNQISLLEPEKGEPNAEPIGISEQKEGGTIGGTIG